MPRIAPNGFMEICVKIANIPIEIMIIEIRNPATVAAFPLKPLIPGN
jgi:hypothetical protein